MNRTDFQAFQQLDQLADRSRKHLYSFSPNDALVQISLPLVLILAIAARLLILSQNLAVEEDKGPAILDLWKQQLILRIDNVLEDWERTSQYTAFPEFTRIQWTQDWPADQRFQQLCRAAQALEAPSVFALELYYAALRYQPTDGEPLADGDPAYFSELYDPRAPDPPAHADTIPVEFHITPERREFALNYIQKRCLSWKEHIARLQWALVAACARRQPVSEQWSDRELGSQMQKLAETLHDRGYPLLSNVTHEYAAEGAGT